MSFSNANGSRVYFDVNLLSTLPGVWWSTRDSFWLNFPSNWVMLMPLFSNWARIPVVG